MTRKHRAPYYGNEDTDRLIAKLEAGLERIKRLPAINERWRQGEITYFEGAIAKLKAAAGGSDHRYVLTIKGEEAVNDNDKIHP